MGGNPPIIICTRTNSARVPRKAFKRVAGLPAIEHILQRIKPSGYPVILAVPGGCDDYNHLQEAYDVIIHRAHDDSPLHRMADAAITTGFSNEASHVVRITHDDLLIDCQSMTELVNYCRFENAGYGTSKGILDGAGVEVIGMQNLLMAARESQVPIEHISYFVKDGPNSKVVTLEPRASIKRGYRLTMDYPEDALVLEIVLRKIGALASNDEICAFMDSNPWLARVNRQPLVSFYTCAYNAEKYIRKAIMSVLHNGIGEFEHIIVDDGSEDNTLLEIAQFSGEPRIRIVLNERNMGLASSSNRALKMARGRFVMRVDADDQVVPGAVENMVFKMMESNDAVIYPAYHRFDGNGNGDKAEVTNPHTFALFNPREFHHAGCALMNTKILNEIRFKDGLRHWDSMELHQRMSKRFKVGYYDAAGFFYRQHPGSMSRKDLAERERIKKEIQSEGRTL